MNIACVVDDETKTCDKDKTDPTAWKPSIKKTLQDKMPVSYTGQELVWEVKVTAEWWDITDFEIWDIMPNEVDYVNWGYPNNEKPEWLTVTKLDKTTRTWEDNKLVYYWDVKWTLKKGNSMTILVYTKVKTMPKAWEDILNIACVVDDETKTCDKDETLWTTNVKIEKRILDKDWNEVKKIKWQVGDDITYKIHFENNWKTGVFVMLKDFLPKNLTIKSSEVVVEKWWTITWWGEYTWGDKLSYDGKFVEVSGVRINVYSWIYLRPGEKWVMTIVWTALQQESNDQNRTNFACIYVDEKRIDCDDAIYEVEPREFKCEKLTVPAWNLPNAGWSKTLTCEASWWVADLIKIDCGNGTVFTWSDTSKLTETCVYAGGANTYYPKCTITKDGTEYDWSNCKWKVIVLGTSCFPAWTKVTMADRSQKNIEDVMVWDIVLSYNTETNTNEKSIVKEKFVHKDHAHEMYELTINGEVLKVTDVHPFYVRKSESSKDYAWIEAQNLKVWDILLMSDGNLAKIDKINHYNNVETVYNLEVADNHDYFVDKWYLVHNKWPTTCFIAWTKVTMADWSQKNIEDVKIWEKVLWSNWTINTVLWYDRPVLGDRHLRSINGSEYFVSDEHPFMTTQWWKSFNPEMTKLEVDLDTTELKVWDVLIRNNWLEEIKTVDYINEDYNTPLYNLMLDGDHTYYANNYLVHNKCVKNCDPDSKSTPYCEKQEEKMKRWEEYDPICELANPHCFNVNEWNFSIEINEFLPFYFNVKRPENGSPHKFIFKDAEEGESCNDYKGAVDLWSLKCRYVIRKPATTTDRINNLGSDIVYELDGIDCLEWYDTRQSKIENGTLIGKWLEKQREVYDIDRDDLHSQYRPNIMVTKSDEWKKSINWDGSLWEYEFQISVYEYKQCREKSEDEREWETEEIDDVNAWVCQSNFVLTEPYTVQKTPSGNLTASTKTLEKFKQVDGNIITPFSSYLSAITPSDYQPNQNVDNAMEKFIDKYEKLAVSVKWDNKKKVPWKNIYFINWDYTINGGDFPTPFTFVQTNKNSTITIVWNSNLNMMILTKWNIAFKWSCEDTQKVKWIFYAKGKLIRTWVDKNTELTNKVWCTEWWLNIKWVLIWNNFNGLMKDSRSHLDTWFKRYGGRSTTDTQELKTKVMNWASVVIEYSPSIFNKSTMPPGAEEFTTALDVYKK